MNACVKLKTLQLFCNQIAGLTAELNYCVDLEHLDVSRNSIRHSIPAWIGKCKKLRKFFIYDNQVGGKIPDEIGNCAELVEVRRM